MKNIDYKPRISYISGRNGLLHMAIAIIILLAVSFTGSATIQAQSHFEGRMNVKFTDVADGGATEEMTLLVKENRLRFMGNLESYTELPMMSGGVTLRADKGDLLMFAEEDKVVVLNLREMGGMLKQMLSEENSNATDVDTPNTELEQTSETRRIHGMEARKYILKDLDTSGNEVHLWASDDLYIDWANLFKPVTELGGGIAEEFSMEGLDWPTDMTPLYAEIMESGEVTSILEITELETREFNNNELDIPEGFQSVSFFEMMMQQQN